MRVEAVCKAHGNGEVCKHFSALEEGIVRRYMYLFIGADSFLAPQSIAWGRGQGRDRRECKHWVPPSGAQGKTSYPAAKGLEENKVKDRGPGERTMEA